jgi:serine/threonine protein kinase
MKIAEGSFAEVYIDEVACKKYKNPYPCSQFLIPEDAIREVSILRHLNDLQVPCVPKFLKIECEWDEVYNQTTTSLYIEVIEGVPFKSILNKALNTDQCSGIVARYIGKILRAVGDIHRAGVVHNDLNLNNIMLTKNQEIKIIDFGYSTFNGAYDLDGTAWASPEVYNEDGGHTHQSDYWTLGSHILNTCLDIDNGKIEANDGVRYVPVRMREFERLLYIMHSRAVELNENLHDSIVIPSLISPLLTPILEHLLQYHPNDRYNIRLPHFQLSNTTTLFGKNHISRAGRIIEKLTDIVITAKMEPPRIGVAIDIVKRTIDKLDDYSTLNITIAIVSLVISNTSEDTDQDNLIMSMMLDNSMNLIEVNEVRMKILELIEWRVFTQSNTHLTIDCDIDILKCRLNQRNTSLKLLGELITMSDAQIRDYCSD